MSAARPLLDRLQEAAATGIALPADQGEPLEAWQGHALLLLGLQLRLSRGEALAGWKVAFASRAAYERFGLNEPVYGALTDVMQLPPASTVDLARFIQPKLEVELAFIIGEHLQAGSYSDEQLHAVVGEMAPAFEVADCRWQGWRFGAGGFLADNAAAAGFCLGRRQPFDAARAAAVEYTLSRDGTSLGQGELGSREDTPLRSLCWVLRRLLEDGQDLYPGQVILSGALLPPLGLAPGQYRLEMLGQALELTFRPAEPA
ncbi:2-keto-4-pentenoate hydratase [Pseudomonas sp. KNUC1026]|uniref:2-keto-4-pentenoate hydratase n=1 Tax=Pseudomonas sp. KNUC1026 TaxID=2893890 RepID=UPI001F160C5B|nr:2-keto-4-pentenoate hydratase [Pseudomonas sp. KNUC1026]UFH50408.1 2-keto-4-pentenoate hydratase [Pseudomonas sp. KNUC1026]